MREHERTSKEDLTGADGSRGHGTTARKQSDTDGTTRDCPDSGRGRRTSPRPGETRITRRSYLAVVGAAASVAAVPAASAASSNNYGDGEYGAETYGGVT